MLRLAEWWSQWSTCRWLQTGAVVFDWEHQVLASGYNGPARGQPHCVDADWPRDEHRYRCLHAERNCIAQAARTGVPIAGASLASTHRPCAICAPHLIQVGIARIVYRHPYGTDGLEAVVVEMLESAGIPLIRLEAP